MFLNIIVKLFPSEINLVKSVSEVPFQKISKGKLGHKALKRSRIKDLATSQIH